MEKDYILDIMRSKNTVFTSKDIALMWGKTDINFIKKKVYRYVKSGKLYSIRRGIYTKDKSYNKYELAVKIHTPSYISFETVLAKEGIVFQFYGQIFIASYLTREIAVNNQTYSFKKIKNTVLANPAGIENIDGYSIATKERAFLDTIYIYKNYYFDNLKPLDWDKVFEILPIYNNKNMDKKVKLLRDKFKANE